MEPDITLLLVMGKPPAVTITGGNEGLAREKCGIDGDFARLDRGGGGVVVVGNVSLSFFDVRADHVHHLLAGSDRKRQHDHLEVTKGLVKPD